MHYYTLESNRQFAKWTVVDEPGPNRPTTQQFADNVMASVFWNAFEILLIGEFKKAQTIKNERLTDEIVKKQSHMKKKQKRFHQDKAP